MNIRDQPSAADLLAATWKEIQSRNRLTHVYPSPGWALNCRLGNFEIEAREKAELLASSDLNRSSLLAAAGFLELLDLSSEGPFLTHLRRLFGSELFPADRNSHAFRPLELLGLTVGLKPWIGEQWIRNHLEGIAFELPRHYSNRPLWEYWIVVEASRLAGISIPPRPESSTALALEELAIIYWRDYSPNTNGDLEDIQAKLLLEMACTDTDSLPPSCLPFIEFALRETISGSLGSLLPLKGSVAEALLVSEKRASQLKEHIDKIERRIEDRCCRTARFVVNLAKLIVGAIVVATGWVLHPEVASNWDKLEPYTWFLPFVLTILLFIGNRQAKKLNLWFFWENRIRNILLRSSYKLVPPFVDKV